MNIPLPYPGEFLRAVIGSTVHGLAITDTDDLDLMGIAIEPPEDVLAMGQPFEQHVFRTQPQNHPSGPGDVDLTTYSLRKFVRLAAKGNPTILNLLFVPASFRHVDGPVAAELRSLIPFIVSREAGGRYLGYMKSQRERLLGLRGQKRTGYDRRLKYQAMQTPDGIVYDTKYAMHLCRLGLQGTELLSTGRITLPMQAAQREILLNIRQGRYTLAEVTDYSALVESRLKAAINSSDLPAHPDRERLDAWLVATYLRHWEAPRPTVWQSVTHPTAERTAA